MESSEPRPRLVAHIALVIAREGDETALANMDRHLVAFEVVADSTNDLAVKLGRYVTDAALGLRVPSEGHVTVARPNLVGQPFTP